MDTSRNESEDSSDFWEVSHERDSKDKLFIQKFNQIVKENIPERKNSINPDFTNNN